MISLLFFCVAGFLNAVMDTLQFHFDKSIFSSFSNSFWNPANSWKNKYNYSPKWLFSGPFVWITDGWHLAKFLMLICLVLAVVFYSPIITFWLDIVLFYLGFTIVFELFYSKIFI